MKVSMKKQCFLFCPSNVIFVLLIMMLVFISSSSSAEEKIYVHKGEKYNAEGYVELMMKTCEKSISEYSECIEEAEYINENKIGELQKEIHKCSSSFLFIQNDEVARILKNYNEKILFLLRKEAIQKFLMYDGQLLRYASDSVKKDREAVKLAMHQNAYAFLYIDESLTRDKEIVQMAVKQNGWLLGEADASLQKDKETVQLAVKQRGQALQFADSSLKKDKETVLIAIREDAEALRYVDESLRKDKAIVQVAIKKNPHAFCYVDESLKKDKETLLIALKLKGRVLGCADELLRKDKKIVQIAIDVHPLEIKYADISIKKNREIVKRAVSKNGMVLAYADESLKKDKEIVQLAVRQDVKALQYVDKSLMNDKEILQIIENEKGATKIVNNEKKISLEKQQSNLHHTNLFVIDINKEKRIVSMEANNQLDFSLPEGGDRPLSSYNVMYEDLNADNKVDMIINLGACGTGGCMYGIFLNYHNNQYTLAFMDYLAYFSLIKEKNGLISITNREQNHQSESLEFFVTRFLFDQSSGQYKPEQP
jgi:hypothetical protein